MRCKDGIKEYESFKCGMESAWELARAVCNLDEDVMNAFEGMHPMIIMNTYGCDEAMDVMSDYFNEKESGVWNDFEIVKEYGEKYLTGEFPIDEPILVTDLDRVWVDCICADGDECFLESGRDITDELYWAELPELMDGEEIVIDIDDDDDEE